MPDPSCRLYLITPTIDDVGPFLPKLEAALAGGDVACVLLRVRSGAEGSAKTLLKPLIDVVRSHDAAALVENDTRLAGHVDADGVHVTAPREDFQQVLRSMKPSRIVGCGGLASRDDAMLAGESGADYVMFGDDFSGEPLPFAERLNRVAWWAEIFEVPCVACAGGLDEVAPLAATGVEFVAPSQSIWADARGPGQAVAEAMLAMREGEAEFIARTAEHA